MKSPFPGMDPYLEKYWHEVHEGLIIYTRDQLQAGLPPELRARVDQRVILEQESGSVRTIYPDVHVVEHPRPTATIQEPRAAVTLLDEEPVLVIPQAEALTEGYIEIVDATSGNGVVTVIEFLSRANKSPGEDREQYRRKQRDVIRAGASLVEIDLTRAGQRTLAIRETEVPLTHRTTFRICVWRAGPPGHFELYRAPLTGRLPAIRIPLRPTDADARLDLQSLVDRCYANGRYDDLDYRADPDPPWEAEEAAQADALLREKKLR